MYLGGTRAVSMTRDAMFGDVYKKKLKKGKHEITLDLELASLALTLRQVEC